MVSRGNLLAALIFFVRNPRNRVQILILNFKEAKAKHSKEECFIALTRKMLKGMGLSDEQVDSIIESHTETVDGLKDQIAALKEDNGSLPEIKKELEKARAELESSKRDSWKTKYDLLKEEYDNYKTEQTQKEARGAKESAYTELLKQAGISEKHIPAVLKVSDVDSISLDESGKPVNEAELMRSIKDEWSDFIPTTVTQGAATPNPPANNGGGRMTKDEIMQIKDHDKRVRAIAENLDLFKKEK